MIIKIYQKHSEIRIFVHFFYMKNINIIIKTTMKKVLAILSINPDYIEFAIPQLKAILSKIPVPLSVLFADSAPLPQKHYDISHRNIKNFPYITLHVPEFEKYRAYFENASRKTVLVSKFILLISEGKNYQELLQNKDEQILQAQCRDWNQLVACDFTSRNRVIARQEQNQKIHAVFEGLDVRGKVNLKNAQKRLQLVEEHTWYQGHHETKTQQTLQKVYFGVELSSCKIGRAKFNIKYQLSQRIYLGPTSTDNDLAFLMCNQANVKVGSLIFDPFVGTGGLLIPPASHGAFTFGCDLDMRVLNGYSVGRINKRSNYYHPDKKLELFTPKIYLNFDQYQFTRPCIFRMDSTKPAFRKFKLFDAIISDPPYGLRAMSRSTKKKNNKQEQKVEEEGQGFLKKQQQAIQYELQEKKMQKKQEDLDLRDDDTDHQNAVHEGKQEEEKAEEGEQSEVEKKKKMKREQKKETRKKRREEMTEEQKKFKDDIVEKLNRERIDKWDKFDKAKIETTEREIIFVGLLNIARKYLKVGGRLVFLYPIYEEEQFVGIENLPPHEDFEVIDMSENKLTHHHSRVLVTMQKTVHHDQPSN